MDSLPLSPSAALKLVKVYQLAHDINQRQQDPLLLQKQKDLYYGQILEQKVAIIFQATSTEIFQKGLKDLLVFIEERLAFDPSKYPDNTAMLREKLRALKNTIIEVKDQSNTQNVQNNF
jgi:hypothetical protein